MGEQLELDLSNGLTQHETDLLDLLLAYRGYWLTPSRIQGKIDYYKRDGSTLHNDGGRLKIRQAIRKLRLDPNTSYLIISSPRGYKIPSDEEAKTYKARLKIAALKKWKLYWTFEEKLALDGQLKMKAHNELGETIAHLEGLERSLKNESNNNKNTRGVSKRVKTSERD